MNSSMSLLFSSSVAISKWTRPTRFKRCLCLSAKPSTTTTTTSVVSEEEPTDNLVVISKTTTKRRKKINNNVIIRSKKDIEAELKEKWLDSLSTSSYASLSSTSPWVVGVDPDVSGAIALLKPVDGLSSAATCSAQFDPCYYCKKAPGRTASLLLGVNMGGMCNNDRHNNSSTILFDNPWTCSPIPAGGLVWQKKRKFRTLIAELHSTVVFDSPHVTILIGNRSRRRLDAKSIVNLLKSFDAPVGTTAYVEQSIPFPQDGKQGWWSGGFGYGLWIGTLVALGFSVVPVPSLAWKNKFCLSGSRSSKDDSRELASTLFPTMCSLLKRKKDHGRAEALLIAAYGRGMKSTDLQGIPEDLM